MMRIPGFENAIFPNDAMANLNLVANLGLVLFLFLVGLEVNVKMFMSNWRVALSVGLAGMLLPFGLGCAIAWGLYNQFRSDPGTVPITFPVYMLFIGTALAVGIPGWGCYHRLTPHSDHCVSGALPNSHRAETPLHSCRRYGPCCWCWK